MLWFDRGGLDAGEYSALSEFLGVRRPRVLAWAPTADGIVVGLPDALVVRADKGWTKIAWTQIVRGGWDSTSSAFTWTLSDGQRGGVAVDEPGRLPELFRERVTASIIVNQPLEDRALRGVTVVARRNPAAPQDEWDWQIIPPAAGPLTRGAQALAEQELARIRADYEIS